jgi:hypothetical protein
MYGDHATHCGKTIPLYLKGTERSEIASAVGFILLAKEWGEGERRQASHSVWCGCIQTHHSEQALTDQGLCLRGGKVSVMPKG